MPEEATASRALAGGTDPATWVDRYGDYLYRFALIRVRQPGLAEELVQETLLAALQARRRFAGRSSERSWLTGILKHKIIDHFRKGSRELPIQELPLAADADEPFDEAGGWLAGQVPGNWTDAAPEALQQKEFFEVLQQCLSGLSPRAADIFTLREIEEQDTQEICKSLGISPTNLWVILHRARIQLRRCLQARWFEKGGR